MPNTVDTQLAAIKDDIRTLTAMLTQLRNEVATALSVEEVARLKDRIRAADELHGKALNQSEAAAYCQKNSQWLLRQRKSARIKARKVGGQWFYRVADLDRLLGKYTT